MNQPIPMFSQPFKGCFLNNYKALDAVQNLIGWDGPETPVNISFALNWLYATLNDRSTELPAHAANALAMIGAFVQQLQASISTTPAEKRRQIEAQPEAGQN